MLLPRSFAPLAATLLAVLSTTGCAELLGNHAQDEQAILAKALRDTREQGAARAARSQRAIAARDEDPYESPAGDSPAGEAPSDVETRQQIASLEREGCADPRTRVIGRDCKRFDASPEGLAIAAAQEKEILAGMAAANEAGERRAAYEASPAGKAEADRLARSLAEGRAIVDAFRQCVVASVSSPASLKLRIYDQELYCEKLHATVNRCHDAARCDDLNDPGACVYYGGLFGAWTEGCQ